MIEECQLVQDEENIEVATDGLKKEQILENFREKTTAEFAKSCRQKFDGQNTDLDENLDIFIKYFCGTPDHLQTRTTQLCLKY